MDYYDSFRINIHRVMQKWKFSEFVPPYFSIENILFARGKKILICLIYRFLTVYDIFAVIPNPLGIAKYFLEGLSLIFN